MIILQDQEAASNADILADTRLTTVGLGRFMVELQASDNDATNGYTVTLSLPNGDSPMLDINVPAGNTSGLAGVIDDRTALKYAVNNTKSGHATLSCVERGSAELTWRVSAISG